MKQFLLRTAILLSFLTGINTAKADFDISTLEGWYVGASASGSMHNDTNLGKDDTSLDHKFGYGFNTQIGYILCDWNIRIEAEFLWHRWKNDNYKPVGATSLNDGGHLRTYAFMGNLLFDMELCDPFSIYLGAGAGYGNTRLSISNTTLSTSTNDWTFAWQLLGGVIWNVNDCWDLTLGYRFLALAKPSLATSTINVKAKVDKMPYSNHVELGARFKF